MEIIFSEERMPGQSIISKMKEAGVHCVTEEGLNPRRITVSVTFVTGEEIRDLNLIYRGKNRVTDVLSFPQYGKGEDFAEEGQICLGDVVICTEQALLQADEFGHSPERELTYLFVHSMFHLLGYDHDDDEHKEIMRRKEEAIMEKVGLSRD
ncbi:MAG: rRNA maturation RNase YbeY [Anaerovoracaceae bacterium]|jgi:probable rRNA maturation factor